MTDSGASAGAPPDVLVDAELLLDAGDVDGAVASFRDVWPRVEDDLDASRAVAGCLRVLVRLGNVDRAVDALLPRLSWLERLSAPGERTWFAATATFVLDRARAAALAPETVDGRPLDDVIASLRETAGEHAAAYDTTPVATEPTLPPTRLPRPAGGPTGGAVHPRTGVLERARVVRESVASLAIDLDEQTTAWLRDRDDLLPVSTPEEWAAASLLDRVSAERAGEPAQQRALLDDALAGARRAHDEAGVLRTEGETALLDLAGAGPQDPDAVAAARARARECAQRLEARGEHVEAAGLWRRIAWYGRSDDPAADLARAAAAYGRGGAEDRRLLCGIEQAMATASTDPARATTELERLGPQLAHHPLLTSMALDVRAQLARSTGDLDAAATLLQQARAVRGTPDRTRATLLAELCDVLVDQEAWDELEGPAADLVAVAARQGDPALLALGQRHLGLAYAETGRPVEAVELLEAALPALREHHPALVGPAAWALGNALGSLGRWKGARTAFATASIGFTAHQRLPEAAHAQWRAGNAAREAGDAVAAADHYDTAAARARACASVGLYVEALRSRGVLRAGAGDLDAGLAELDAAVAAGERLAAEAGVGDDEFDAEVLEPHVLRQGAHLLARAGRVDEAVDRLARAEALVGSDFELVLRAEAGMLLADADRLDEAEPRLRASLAELHAAGLEPVRVEAARALSRALDRSGREADAAEVWARHGPQR